MSFPFHAVDGFIHSQQFPLIYAFLPSRSRADYNRMFTLLKEEVQNLQIQFDPQAVMADFELALLQSLEIQFPSASNPRMLFPLLPVTVEESAIARTV